jgi:hypothetical protein
MTQKKNWIITTSPNRKVRDVAKKLQAAGFTVGRVNDAIGSISGSADDRVAKALRSIEGVADVSADSAVDIGPPGGRDTW